MTDLSIIIVSYNTAEMTEKCLSNLLTVLQENKDIRAEVIVVDNASVDSTKKILDRMTAQYEKSGQKLIRELGKKNLGYSKANNKGLLLSSGTYILFLNSDVLMKSISFKNLLANFEQDSKLGALTVRVELENGQIDPASHRGFPTIWRSFCYYAGLEKIFRKVPLLGALFGGYHLTSRSLATTHEIDSPTGAFYLSRKEILDKVKGFDEDFFMYGEDLDLSYRIKELGYKILYVPTYSVTHLKYQSGIKSSDQSTKKKTHSYFYDAMKIFYTKHYASSTPQPINSFIFFIIDQKAKRS